MTVHLYSDAYVNKLEWSRRILLLLLGIGLGVALVGIWKGSTYTQSLNDALRASEAVIQGLQTENAEYKDALKDYTEKKGKITSLILKTNRKLTRGEASHIAALQLKYARQQNIPIEILVAVPIQESGYKPNAVSYTGCCLGLYQLNYQVHKEEYGLTSRNKTFDIETNIRVGSQMLADHHRKYGSFERALGRYYGSTKPEENVQYARQVLAKSRYVLKQIG